MSIQQQSVRKEILHILLHTLGLDNLQTTTKKCVYVDLFYFTFVCVYVLTQGNLN